MSTTKMTMFSNFTCIINGNNGTYLFGIELICAHFASLDLDSRTNRDKLA